MKCYLCEGEIAGPAVPRRHEETGEQVLLHPECWESCVGCCAPVHVFEPISAFGGEAMPFITRDRGDHLLADIGGLRLHLCDDCAAS